MSGNPEKIIQQVEVRQSHKHSLCMHNAIVKLSKMPLGHFKGRRGVENSILHLRDVHHVMVTPQLMEMLLAANPSENILQSLA
jgi:hypothetical protein